MDKLFCLKISIVATFLLASTPLELKSQFQHHILTQNAKEPTWIAIDKKSSSTVAVSSTKLGHSNNFVISPKSTGVHLAQVTEATLTQFIKLNPNDAEAYFHQGFLRAEAKNYQGAQADYSQVIKLIPSATDA